MQNLSMIACVSQDHGLGYQGQLLWNFPEDMAFFRRITLGHPVVMGGTTFTSIGHPLPGRENIILSRHLTTEQTLANLPAPLSPDTKITICASDTELRQHLATLSGETFIIGGASLYALFLPDATTLYLTEVAATRPADVFFPTFNPAQFTHRTLQEGTHDNISYRIVKYQRRAVS